jgi:hypothetical protein
VAERYRDRVRYYQLWERPCATTLLAMPDDVYALYHVGAQAIRSADAALQVIAPEPADVDLGWIASYLRGAQGVKRPDIVLLTPSRHVLTPSKLWWRLHVLRERVITADAPALWVDIPYRADKADAVTLMAAALVDAVPVVFVTPQPGESMPLTLAQARHLFALRGYTCTGATALGEQLVCAQFRDGEQRRALLLPSAPATVRISPAAAAPHGDGLIAVGETITLTESGQLPRQLDVTQPMTLEMRGPAVLDNVDLPAHLPAVRITPHPVSGNPVRLAIADGQACDPAALCAMPDFSGGRFRTLILDGRLYLSTIRDLQPWIHFDVPDGFLYFNETRTPVEITVTVLGVRQRNKTGFNLYYDGRDGMSYSRWQWIDVGRDRLFTYKFILSDAQFANRDGYDFRLNMAGSEENVRVADITVRKLR